MSELVKGQCGQAQEHKVQRKDKIVGPGPSVKVPLLVLGLSRHRHYRRTALRGLTLPAYITHHLGSIKDICASPQAWIFPC